MTNKVGDTLPLPISYYDKIHVLPDIAGATYMARSRATYRTPANFLGLTAVEPLSFATFIGDQYDIPRTPLPVSERFATVPLSAAALLPRRAGCSGRRSR